MVAKTNSVFKQQEMILISFYRASEGTTTRVPYEELVLQLWRDFPEVFSMRNHPEHPDASDVHKKLYNGPLKIEGLVVSLGNKVFRLTDKGVAQAAEVVAHWSGKKPATVQDKGRLSRQEQEVVRHAQKSRALQTWKAGQADKLVDYDARVFFQFSTSTKLDERKRKVNFAHETFAKAQELGIGEASEMAELTDFLVNNFVELLKESIG